MSKSIFLPTLIQSSKNFLINSIAFFLAIYLDSIGYSGLKIGLILSVFAVTSLFSSAIAGIISDRSQIKFVSIISFSSLMIYLFFLSTTKNFWIILFLFFLGGLGNNVSDIALKSYVMKIIPKKGSEKALGKFNSVITVASGSGALLGGIFLVNGSFENIFLLLAVLFFLLILITSFLPKIGTFKYSISYYKKDLFKKKILLFLILIFIFTIHWGAEGTSYALFLKNNLFLDQFSSAVYIGTMWILFGVMIYFIGLRIRCDSSLKKLIYYGLIFSGVGHILFVFSGVYLSYIFRLFHELGDAMFQMFLVIGIFRHFPTERIGGTSGVVLTVTIAGKFLGSLLFGSIGDIFGYGWPFIISGVMTLFCLVIAYHYFKEI